MKAPVTALSVTILPRQTTRNEKMLRHRQTQQTSHVTDSDLSDRYEIKDRKVSKSIFIFLFKFVSDLSILLTVTVTLRPNPVLVL